ncbi:DUF4286 family protein [Paradesertivirga mongoliensis]|uniref:DUF4286 family protein n=1 Tax=Paradesertivirga mongoliensis TaxID=2100740 RepID=A0ABW4ZH02_9SPHI|nr:DUF4286 family protein [Pedobacter mongoliensis]
MILYNITVIIDEGIEAEWLQWVNETFVPEALSSNLLVSNRTLKVLDSPNEGFTYCLQFIADNLQNYNQFKDNHASALLDSLTAKFKNQSVHFSTIMEFIN